MADKHAAIRRARDTAYDRFDLFTEQAFLGVL